MTNSATRAVSAVILALGGSGIAAQTLLLRELLVIFGGNEFSLGAIIGNWVAAGALGALAGSRIPRLSARPVPLLAGLTSAFSLLLPLTLLSIRLYRPLTGLSPDLGLGIDRIFISSLLLLLPVGFSNGLLFVVACAAARESDPHRGSAGRVYALSTIGTIAGGLLTGYVLIPRVSPLTAAALLLLLNGIACLYLWSRMREGVGRYGLAAPLAVILAGVILLSGEGERLQRISLSRQWQGKELRAWRNSPYQNIVVVGTGDQYTVYSDGLPLLALPDPDIGFVEEFTHLPLLAHPRPERVLVLGGGAGGVIGEILKYRSVRQVDYVELDPLLLATVTEFALAAGRREMGDPRVRLINRDGRSYLRDTTEQYDLVLLDLPLPRTLAENRFFTEEFFLQVRRALRSEGILAVTAAGSLTYYGRELKEANASLRATVGRVFPRNVIVPGDINLIFAATGTALATCDALTLAQRLQERGIATSLISPAHLKYLLSGEEQRWHEEATHGAVGEVNRDFSPRLLVHNLAHTTILFTPRLKPVLDLLYRLTLPVAAALALAVTTIVGVPLRCRRKAAVTWAVATTGFAGMVLELVLIYTFQVFQGAMFHAIGLLLTTFMTGIAGGSILMTGASPSPSRDRRRLLCVEGGIILMAAGTALCLTHADALPTSTALQIYGLIIPLLITAGFLVGAEFPLAVRLVCSGEETETATAGAIYGADLLGGWLGGTLGGALLAQSLGLAPTCLLLALLKCGSWLILKVGFRRV